MTVNDPIRDLLLDDDLPVPAARVDVLPADFPLPRLIKFVPDAAKKARLDRVTAWALEIAVTGTNGLEAADAALSTLRAELEAVRADFDEPKKLAHRLHAHITTLLGEYTAAADAAIKTIGQRIFTETRRLEAVAAEERRQRQAAADAAERARLAREAEAAKAARAPAEAVRELQRQAETATAAPVETAPAPALKGSTPIARWLARPKGTPATADPNPKIADMTPLQIARVVELVGAIVAGQASITLIEINWTAVNARARSDKSAFQVPGLEAFESGATRAKGRRA